MIKKIKIKGAKENNLKSVNLEIPRDKLVVFTGVSGSGKSTLAFDTIFAEGQRKFIESLSSYARQFLGQIQKPNIESIEGLSPSISIDQKTTSHNPRSTVGTVTEIYDYLRLLYANVGTPFCPSCKKEISNISLDQIIDKIRSLENGAKINIEAPIVSGRKGQFAKILDDYKKSGYVRARIDDKIYNLYDSIELEKNIKHNINIIVDRAIIKQGSTERISESIEKALEISKGVVIVRDMRTGEFKSYNINNSCAECGYSFPKISPRLFSFNNPYGACSRCSGIGVNKEIDANLILSKNERSINQGAFDFNKWRTKLSSITKTQLVELSKTLGFSLNKPLKDLDKSVIDVLLYGYSKEITFSYSGDEFGGEYKFKYKGIVPDLQQRYNNTSSEYVKKEIEKYMKSKPCPSCNGARLNKDALSIYIASKNIYDVTSMSIEKIALFMQGIIFSGEKEAVSKDIIKEIRKRLEFLLDVGLEYLTLSRDSSSLSGGEAQRIRLATQIGSGLAGVLYILDEPSIGLHQRDNERLLRTLKNLRDIGNTLIVVEHDEDTIKAADYIVDIGPYAGENGGEIVAQGSLEDVKNTKKSVTGKFLRQEDYIEVPNQRRSHKKGYLLINGAKKNNLKNIDIKIPFGTFNVVTGVSGSGKSSLVNNVIVDGLSDQLKGKSNSFEVDYKDIENYKKLDKVIDINQSPIGRTPRSNPATYTGVFDLIRALFASLPISKEKGYKPGRFSFNVVGGRCDACNGDGLKKVEMYFLPDIYVPCEVCGGKRYNNETLKVKYKNKNIYDVLSLTVDQALEIFKNITTIKNKIRTLQDVGLGYIKLGQFATTLSGGEAQRVKLASELSKRSTGRTLYVLDEPTTGLHPYDVKKLIDILQRLVDKGNTVLVIEHNMDVIKAADYIIDLGPEGGDKGGNVVCSGSPEQVKNFKKSYTGNYLKKIL